MHAALLILPLLLSISAVAFGAPQCYFQVGPTPQDPEVLGPGSNRLSAVTLVISINTDADIDFYVNSLPSVANGLNSYQLLARHVFSYFSFNVSGWGLLGIPYDPNQKECSETCVRIYGRSIRIVSEIFSPHLVIDIAYNPPPMSHPTQLRVRTAPQAIVGPGWTCRTLKSVVSDRPYIVSAIMYSRNYFGDLEQSNVLVSFSTNVRKCSNSPSVIAHPLLSSVKGDVSVYASRAYSCTLMDTLSAEVWTGGCPTVLGFDPYYVYGVVVEGMCDSNDVPLLSNSFEYPLRRTRGWIRAITYGGTNTMAPSDILLCMLDWTMATRYAIIYDPQTKQPIRMIYKTPYPLDARTTSTSNWVNWGITWNSLNYIDVPINRLMFSGTSLGILQTLVTAKTVGTRLGYWPESPSLTIYQPFVPSSVFIPIDSGTIYATLTSSWYKQNDVNQNPDGSPLYPSLVATTTTVIPSNKMQGTTIDSHASEIYPIVRYVSSLTSTSDVSGLRVLDIKGAAIEHYESVQYGAGNPPSSSLPNPSVVGFGYLSSIANSAMPVFGWPIAVSAVIFAPSAVVFMPTSKILRVLFTKGDLTTRYIDNAGISISCNGKTASPTLAIGYGPRIDLTDPIGCLRDPISVTITSAAIRFRQIGVVPDAYMIPATITSQLGAWIPVSVSLAWIAPSGFSAPTGYRLLTVVFNRTIFSATDAGISVACGSSSFVPVSGLVGSGNTLTALAVDCGLLPGSAFLSIQRYAVLFDPLETGEATALASSINAYPAIVIGNISASFYTPTCIGGSMTVPVVPAGDTTVGLSVVYRLKCDGQFLRTVTTVFGPGSFVHFLTQSYTSCSFFVTFQSPLVSLILLAPNEPCLEYSTPTIAAYFDPIYKVVYARLGTDRAIDAGSILRSKFSATCDGIPSVVQFVSVGRPDLVNDPSSLSQGPVLVVNISTCVLDLVSGVLNLTFERGAFYLSDTNSFGATVLMGPKFEPVYKSRDCRVQNDSSGIHVNNLTFSLPLNGNAFIHSPDGCVHALPPAVSGSSVVFFIKTIPNRPCNSRLDIDRGFRDPYTIFFSYGHCDDLPYFNLDPIVDYVFTGSINGQPYNADYGQYGSGGVIWKTKFSELPGVQQASTTAIGGLKDSVGVPGLNLTGYCNTAMPTIMSVNPLLGFVKMRRLKGDDGGGIYDVLFSNWTIVVAFDQQEARSVGDGFNPLRPAGKHSITTATNAPYINDNDDYVPLIRPGRISGGSFKPDDNFEITVNRDGKDVKWRIGYYYDIRIAQGDYLPVTGRVSLVYQQVCVSTTDCKNRAMHVDATGKRTIAPAAYEQSVVDANGFQKIFIRNIGGLYGVMMATVDIHFSANHIPGDRVPYFPYGANSCMDYRSQYILQNTAIYNRNLTDAELELVLQRRPLNGTASVGQSVLLGQHIKYNTTKEAPVFWYPAEMPWLFNESVRQYSLILDGRNETTSFVTPGTFGYTLTVGGQPIRPENTVFRRGLTVNLIPREAPLAFKSLTVDLPAFANISLLNNINVYQIAANANRIREITVFTSPSNTSFFVANGTSANPVFISATQTGNYSIDRDFVARWQFVGTLPSRVDVLGLDYTTMGATDQAMIVPNVLDPEVVTLLLKTPIVPPLIVPYAAVEDTATVFQIAAASVFSESGIPERCDTVILISLPNNGSFQLVDANNGNSTTPITRESLPVVFNCTTHRLLFTPDLDFDLSDYFFIVYNCSITQSVPRNLTINIVPVEDAPKTTSSLTDTVVVSDAFTYPYVPFDVREVDSRESEMRIDITMPTYTTSFFNRSMVKFMLSLSTSDISFLRGDPDGLNPIIQFTVFRNRTLFHEVLKSIRILCGTVTKGTMSIGIRDKRQFDTGTALVFIRNIDCQVTTVGAASDPDTPSTFVPGSPGSGTTTSSSTNLLFLILALIIWPFVGIGIVCFMFAVKNTFNRYKNVAQSSIRAADALSKGDFKGAVKEGVSAAKLAAR